MARTKLKAPDLSYLVQLRTELEERHRANRDVLQRIRELRELKRPVSVPQSVRDMAGGAQIEYRDATVADELLRAPSIFTDAPPKLVIKGAGTDRAVDLATRLKHFTTTALLDVIGCREPGPSTFERLVDATFEGGGWTKLVPDRSLWDERDALTRDAFADDDGGTADDKYDRATEDAKKKAGIPVHWLSVDALSVLPVFYGARIGEVLEVQERALSPTFRQYRLGLDADGGVVPEETAAVGWRTDLPATATCEFLIHTDDTYVTYVVRRAGGREGTSGADGAARIVRQYKHKMGAPNYFCSLGLTKNYERGVVATWSIAETKRYLCEYLSFLRTLYALIGVRDAIPPVFEEIPLDADPIYGDDGKPRSPQRYELGMKYTGVPGQKLVPMVFPDTSRNLQAEIAQAKADKADLSPPRVPADLGDMGASGFAASTAITEGRLYFSAAKTSIQRHLKEVTEAFWRILEQIDEPVYVLQEGKDDADWIKVDPDRDLTTPFAVRWELQTDTTAAEIILERLWSARVLNGSAGRDQMIEALDSSPTEVHKAIAKDQVRAQPWFQQQLQAEVLAEWGRGDLLRMQQQAEQMAAFVKQANAGVAAAGGVGGGGLPTDQDQASLAVSPNGAGAQPGQEFQPGPVANGMGGTPVTPVAGAAAQAGAFRG